MSFRPTKLGKDPMYALSDPGCEYIRGVTATFFGPLAARWGIEGKAATFAARRNLYNGIMPNGWWPFARPEILDRFRPVHGGNFHSCKTLDMWLVRQSEAVRRRVERMFCETATEVLRERILPDVTTRKGGGGKEKVPAEGLAVAFLHTEASGYYHLHVLVEIHNVGLGPDGKLGAIDNKFLFHRQGLYGVEFEARLAFRLHREFGLLLRPHGKTVELKGLEHLRDVKTPRQEEMAEELAAKDLPATPKTLHYAASKTHRPRSEGQTKEHILQRTRLWAYSRSIDAKHAAIETQRHFGRWWELTKATRSVKAAIKAVNRVGQHVSFDEIRRVALRKAAWWQADPKIVDTLLAEATAKPESYGLYRVEKDVYSTLKTELSRARWECSLARLGRKRPRRPSELALDRLRLSSKPPTAEEERSMRQLLRRRVTVMSRPTAIAKVAIDAYRADNRRVFAVAPEATQDQIRQYFGVGVQDPNALAVKLEKNSAWKTFLQVRRHRWRSLKHVEYLRKQAKKPELVLTRNDVLLIDARRASHHAMRTIARCARKAGSTVILINSETPPARGRTIVRDDPGRDR